MIQEAVLSEVFETDFEERLRRALDSRRVLASARSSASGFQENSASLVDCVLERLHQGSKIGPIAEYEMKFASGERRLHRRMFVQIPYDAPGKAYASAVKKVRRRNPAVAELFLPSERLIYLEDIGAILRPEGIDERVDGLWLLEPGGDPASLEASKVRPGWQDFLARSRDGFDAHLLAHRLGKRAVLRLSTGQHDSGDARTAIIKFYKRTSTKLSAIATRQMQLARQFEELDDVCAPRVLATFATQRGIATECVEGRPLADLEGAEAVANYGLAGTALARLHKLRLRAHFHTAIDEQAMLKAVVARVLGVDATFAEPFVLALAAANRRRKRYQPFEPCIIHRDFHEKQVISDGKRACLIDFDMVAHGDPAQDLANFLAHTMLRQLQTGVPMAENMAAFADGYRRHGLRCAAINLEFHLLATFTRLAAILTFSDRWRHLVPGLLQWAIDCETPSALARVSRDMRK